MRPVPFLRRASEKGGRSDTLVITGDIEWAKDLTDMKPELHERKWEVDSLCYPVRLAHGYWRATGDASVFDAEWRAAAELVLKVRAERPHLLRARL